jgi:hypothetical protein
MAGFVGSTIYQCEPSYPHAWPQGTYTDDFRVQLPHPLVTLKVRGSSLVALTAGPAYFVSGAQPDQMTVVRLDGTYPCVSKRSAAETPDGVLYASAPGLVIASENGLRNTTAELMDADDWDDLYPDSMHAVFFGGKYIAGYNSSRIAIIDIASGIYTQAAMAAHAMHISDDDGKLYVAVNEETDPDNPPATVPIYISEWQAHPVAALYYNWESGDILLPAAVNFGAARVTVDEEYAAAAAALAAEDASIEDYNEAIFSAGGVSGGIGGDELNVYGLNGDALKSPSDLQYGTTTTFRWHCDGVLKYSKTLSASDGFRLPGGFRSRRFKAGVDGYVPVRKIEIASGMEELYTE